MGNEDLELGKRDARESTSDDNVSPADSTLEKAVVTPVTHPEPLRDGGTRAWLQVLGSFLVFSNLWGFVFSFGSFQSYYSLTYLPSKSASSISWIGTVATGLLIMVGVASGPLFDRGYFRSMVLVGGLGETFAVFMLSLCTQYWQIMLTQGVLTGLMNGLLYLPGLALVGRSFKKHRSIAMALTTCGAPVGGIIYTLMFEQLINKLGFAWTIRAMAFFMLGSYLIAFPLLLYRAGNLGDLAAGGARRKLFDPTALRDLPFWAYAFSNFFLFLGYMIPFTYLAIYGQTELGMTQSASLNMLVTAQAASIAGRLIAGYAARKIGVMIPWITAGLLSGAFCIAWIGIKSEGALIVYAILYGCFSGPLIPLPPSIFPVVCPDPKVLGARLGMAQGIGSIASLIGAPIAGALLKTGGGARGREGRNYVALQLFSGLVMMGGGGQLVNLYVLLRRRREVGRWI